MKKAKLSAKLAAARERLEELEAAEAERRRAEQVQDALYRIAETASAAQDMQEFYAAIHGIVGELMYAKNFYITLYDEERQLINWPFYVDELDTDLPDPNVWEELGTGTATGTTAYVLRTGEPQLHPVRAWMELAEQGEIELVGVITEHTSWLGVPLKSDGKTLGVLVVQSYTEGIRYTEEDKELLTYVGQHVASALQRTRLLDETRQRVAELALINSVQEGLAGELELQAIYDLVGDKLRDIFDAQVVDIGVYDAEAGLVRFPYTIERGVRFPDEPIPLIGFRRHVMETREPLMINEDIEIADEQYGNPAVHGRGAVEVGDLDAARRRRRGHGRHLDPEPGPGARVHRVRPAAPGDARQEPERGARERPPDRRDAAARRRARHRQQRRAGARGASRSPVPHRPRRREDARDVRRRHRLRGAPRAGERHHRLPLLQRARQDGSPRRRSPSGRG